ncbi:anti-sigma regulatory factor (Ser/Thr protein kinase) [Actinocorallia herbida]|uniref:Anti-sigma regulatory factor (Ser/Thr protein kinase) n=1 Tax=Actinocorallia herbida TaxID=58109 RepID=A0A3N1D883_9ACTN|nr:ATP-binding protein [Actinocorallia herbida]ROO89725.1 anti-sigma regulatory factor (Ser/Thr protein kinase) [Actinocorallia herbida]
MAAMERQFPSRRSPRRSPLALPDGSGPRAARAHAASLAREFGVPEDARIALGLVVSELCTNAHLHARGPGMPHPTCSIRMGVGRCVLEVWDHLPWQDLRATAEAAGSPDGAESGRGLTIVTALAESWGVRPSARGGKVVWAVLAW